MIDRLRRNDRLYDAEEHDGGDVIPATCSQ